MNSEQQILINWNDRKASILIQHIVINYFVWIFLNSLENMNQWDCVHSVNN